MPEQLKQMCWAEAHTSSDLRFLFITPERIEYSIHNIGKIYDKGNLARFVIDEAQCAVQVSPPRNVLYARTYQFESGAKHFGVL